MNIIILFTTGVRFPVQVGIFSLRHHVQTGCGPHSTSFMTDTKAVHPKLKLPLPETDHSPPSSVQVKKAWSFTSIPDLEYVLDDYHSGAEGFCHCGR
jgi:hypothetical protein